MRWCAALALVLVALVAVTVKVMRRHPRPPVAADPERAERAPPPVAPPRAPDPPPRRESSGIAHLRGRVLSPGGRNDADGLPDLKVTADDGRRTFDARIIASGRFAFHMPPGRYAVTAWAGDLVGEVRDVIVAADAEREVDIRLVMAARIGGHLHAPDNADVDVVARPTGSERPDNNGATNEGAFLIQGLIPDRLYDIAFSGSGIRALKLTGVKAPTETMDVTLEARAVMRVAIGFPIGERCPIDTVKVRARSDDGEQESGFVGDRIDCRFELPAPLDTGEVTVVAQGNGWLLQTATTIPEHGDPEPICLNPPCRANPLEGSARLRLALDGADADSPISADVVPVNDSDGASHSCGGSNGACDIEGLRPGETFSISASGRECRADPLSVTVVAGDNHVRLPCQRQRRIEGVIRIPDGQQPDLVVVRCAGGDSHPMIRTRLFRLTCGADVAALEYQIGSQGSWRSIPIASLADLAFVDIGSY